MRDVKIIFIDNASDELELRLIDNSKIKYISSIFNTINVDNHKSFIQHIIGIHKALSNTRDNAFQCIKKGMKSRFHIFSRRKKRLLNNPGFDLSSLKPLKTSLYGLLIITLIIGMNFNYFVQRTFAETNYIDIQKHNPILKTYVPVLITDNKIPYTNNEENMGGSEEAYIQEFLPLFKPTIGKYSQGFSGKHAGVDIANKPGTSIYAAASGKVVYAKTDGWNTGYGRVIKIEHKDGYMTVYAHLNELYVKEGEYVRREEKIGAMGSTGLSSGPHLHFEIYKNGVKVDPKEYYEEY